jgi:hypothetical protein
MSGSCPGTVLMALVRSFRSNGLCAFFEKQAPDPGNRKAENDLLTKSTRFWGSFT